MENEIIESYTCFNCANYLGDLSCLAFAKIPSKILSGENDHSKPLPKQGNSIVFEPIVNPKNN